MKPWPLAAAFMRRRLYSKLNMRSMPTAIIASSWDRSGVLHSRALDRQRRSGLASSDDPQRPGPALALPWRHLAHTPPAYAPAVRRAVATSALTQTVVWTENPAASAAFAPVRNVQDPSSTMEIAAAPDDARYAIAAFVSVMGRTHYAPAVAASKANQ